MRTLHGIQTAWQSTGAKIQIIPRQGMLITEAHAESHHGVNAMMLTVPQSELLILPVGRPHRHRSCIGKFGEQRVKKAGEFGGMQCVR